MIRLLTSFTFILFWLNLGAQCECEDCPVDTPANVPVTASLSITGATNDQINENGQRICEICIDLEHQAIREISMELTAPDGSSVELMIDDGLAFGH